MTLQGPLAPPFSSKKVLTTAQLQLQLPVLSFATLISPVQNTLAELRLQSILFTLLGSTGSTSSQISYKAPFLPSQEILPI